MEKEIEKRLRWIKLYEKLENAGIVCLKCGISRPTLRKWLKRYSENGLEGLKEESRRPKSSPNRKVTNSQEEEILRLRKERNLGHRRIKSELMRHDKGSLSTATIHKVLQKHGEERLKNKLTNRKKTKRYNRQIPGERIQMDVCKIAPGKYQYTAIDDCSRYKVLALYSHRTAANTLLFLDKVVEEMPFSIQRIQTDRGQEFFAYSFQERLMEWGIKFRPIRPASPHLNGKVERSQKTDLQEFYAIVNLKDEKLECLLQEWQHYYNWERPHSSLGGKCPIDKVVEISDKTPLREEVEMMFDESKERIRSQKYIRDFQAPKLKLSL